jgi:ligand-binding sensor domain-containing protein
VKFSLTLLILLSIFNLSQQTFGQQKPFTLFTEDDGLANNGVRSITKDREGILWLGTENGLSKYDGQKFINIRKSDGLPGNRVWAVESDQKGKIYAACYNSGLAVIENSKVSRVIHLKSKFHDSFRQLYYSVNFQMLFVGTDFGIYVLKDSTLSEIPLKKDSKKKFVILRNCLNFIFEFC